MIEAYFDTVVATFVMLVTVVVQHMVATIANGQQKNMIPGVVNKELGHESFVFTGVRRKDLEEVIETDNLCENNFENSMVKSKYFHKNIIWTRK